MLQNVKSLIMHSLRICKSMTCMHFLGRSRMLSKTKSYCERYVPGQNNPFLILKRNANAMRGTASNRKNFFSWPAGHHDRTRSLERADAQGIVSRRWGDFRCSLPLSSGLKASTAGCLKKTLRHRQKLVHNNGVRPTFNAWWQCRFSHLNLWL